MRRRPTRAICIIFLTALGCVQTGWAGALPVHVSDEGGRPAGEESCAPEFPLKVSINLKLLSLRPVDSARQLKRTKMLDDFQAAVQIYQQKVQQAVEHTEAEKSTAKNSSDVN